ncbi:MAG TPA: hypothetical protein VKU00_24225, partial [Chthonomonadaceae bacterium]|nr:hypothetical protein [Chthonomonadaceae bacterium]
LCLVLARYDPDSIFANLNLISTYLDAKQPKKAGQLAEGMLTRIFGSQIWRQPEAALRTYHAHPAIAYYIRQGMGNRTPAEFWVAAFYARLGLAWLARNNHQSCEACLYAGLRFDPRCFDINLASGKYECTVKRYADAIPYLRLAQSSDPSIPETYLLLGDAYLAQRDWLQARAQYQTLIGLQPWMGPAYVGLAEAQQHLGDTAGVQATLEAARHRAILTDDQIQRMIAKTR